MEHSTYISLERLLLYMENPFFLMMGILRSCGGGASRPMPCRYAVFYPALISPAWASLVFYISEEYPSPDFTLFAHIADNRPVLMQTHSYWDEQVIPARRETDPSAF